MPMMALVADVHAHVVQQPSVFEPLPFAVAQLMHAPRLIEDREREAGDLLRVLRPVSAPLAELDDAAAADVGVALDLPDAGAVSVDVIEDESFAERQIAERELVGAQAADDGIEKDGAGDAEIGAARVHGRNREPLLEIGVDDLLPDLVERLRGDAQVAKVFDARA